MSKRILVTGAAGFIGSHASQRLLARGDTVVGLDNLNDYYSVQLKEDRLARLRQHKGFEFVKLDLADRAGMEVLFQREKFDAVIHLAAQAGVRYSITNPHVYVDSNVTGFLHILEGCRHSKVGHLVFASTSSVYGANELQPFSEHHGVDHPMTLYAATKKANELMAHSYAHLYGMAVTGLRFFTVYGPWGRPDMALFLFTKGILEGTPINVFNHGKMIRDFTYVEDIVSGVIGAMDRPAQPNPDWNALKPDPATSYANYRIFNIGNNQPVQLMEFIEAIEEAVGKKAIKNFLPMQDGDVPSTCADVSELESWTGFRPNTPVQTGVRNFVDWYRAYYKV
ncbi:NAD-dependent epimerase [Permianibacter fluminis]|uniref:NAD-dependent epimerase n=1 Tax=Permianibacter fluminis TaxID=2738515 RepID=UPI002E29335D|nr:NAD-dependent epimerase [Permianibacter fluminis]